jgi:hypothetical protein
MISWFSSLTHIHTTKKVGRFANITQRHATDNLKLTQVWKEWTNRRKLHRDNIQAQVELLTASDQAFCRRNFHSQILRAFWKCLWIAVSGSALEVREVPVLGCLGCFCYAGWQSWQQWLQSHHKLSKTETPWCICQLQPDDQSLSPFD